MSILQADEVIYRVPIDDLKGDHSSTPIHYTEGLKVLSNYMF